MCALYGWKRFDFRGFVSRYYDENVSRDFYRLFSLPYEVVIFSTHNILIRTNEIDLNQKNILLNPIITTNQTNSKTKLDDGNF